MRLLCVTDIHFHLPQMDWLLDTAPGVDVVILPGDHLQVGGRTPLEAQVVVVARYLERLARSSVVLAASGNHDLDGPGPDGEQRAGWLLGAAAPPLYVDGDSVDLEGVRFTICPWWDGPATKEMVDAQLRAAAIDRPASWVWVYHSPPAGTRLCTTGARGYPDEELAHWIEEHRPDIVICGHIHQAPWAPGGGWVDQVGSTWVFNAGHQVGPIPAHIVIDLDAETAKWFGQPEFEEVDLRSRAPEPASGSLGV